MNLKRLVLDKIEGLGTKDAAKHFGVSIGTISNWSSGKTEPSIEAVQLSIDDSFVLHEPASEELAMWEGRKVMLLLPVYRTFNADTHYTLFANYAKYGPEKLAIDYVKRTVIHEARNMLIDRFMKTPSAETAIMFDDDMILPCGNAGIFNGRFGAGVTEQLASVCAISRLMAHGKDKGIVGGLYFGRHDAGKAQCEKGFSSNTENEKLRLGRYSGLVPTGWVGTGAIKIEKWVIEKMKHEIDEGRWPDCKPNSEDSWYGYFNPIRVRVGEDVSFGRRAEEIGIRSYVDAGLVCLHNGERNYGPSNVKSQL